MTENGWPPDTRARPGVSLPRDQMDDNPIPGTNIRIPLQRGIPNTIMKAFAADFNMHVEPLNNGRGRNDEGGWTPSNSVATSNHLGGTAMDLNWSDHPFRVHNAGFDEREIAVTRELLAFYEGMIFWGNDWENPRDSMHFQMGYNTFDNIPKCEDFIRRKILPNGFSIFRKGVPAPPPPSRESYGLPPGSNSGGYGGGGVKFPDWVYQLGNAFGVKPSTYPGHQEGNRVEAGYAPNPQRLNRGIDWAAPGAADEIDRLTRFADYLATIPQYLEQVIWQNPKTMRSIEVAGGRHQPGYFRSDLAGHRDHVHTRQSASIPGPGAPAPLPSPSSPPRAEILARAVGLELGKAQSILVGVVAGLRASQCTNVNRIAMWLAQMGHESANFKATEEFASGEAYNNRADLGNTQPGDGPRFKGRTWIQITGRFNYTKLSKWAFDNGIVPTPTYFVDNSTKLAEMQYAGLGPAWYWTVARPQINSLCDKRDLVGVTQAINGGQHGAPDRSKRWNRALALGDELLTLTSSVEPSPPLIGEDDFLSALSAQEQRDLFNAIMNKRQSRSPLRSLGQGEVGDAMDQIWDIDGSVHVLIVAMLASLRFPDPEALALLQEVAEADVTQFPERARDKKLARAILAGLGATPAPPVQVTPISVSTSPVVYQPEVLPAVREPVRGNTPEDLLDTMSKLDMFKREFDKRFDQLAGGKEIDPPIRKEEE